MFETPLNAKTVTLKIRRIDLCDLMMACTAVSTSLDNENDKKRWDDLHGRLDAILKEFDKKQGY